MDQHLLAIAQAAERGLECPPVRVLAGGLVIWGAPGPSSEFLDANREPLIAQYEEFAAAARARSVKASTSIPSCSRRSTWATCAGRAAAPSRIPPF